MQGRNYITRRSFLGLSAATAASVILAGCSSSGASSSSAAASAASSSASASSSAASSSAASAASSSAASSSAAASAAASGARPLVRLGTTNDGHIFNAIASAQGFLEEEGVDVQVSVFSSSDEAFAALFSNKVDVLSNQGTNLPLYQSLSAKYRVNITASGGVSTMADVTRLASMGLYAAIIGKAYYTGAVSLKEAVEEIE